MPEYSFIVFEVKHLSNIKIRKFHEHLFCSENILTIRLVSINRLSLNTSSMPIIKDKLSSDPLFDYYYKPKLSNSHYKTFYEAYRIIPSKIP